MADGETRTVTEDMVEQLALLAELDLDAERRAVVAEQLEGLLPDANAVNRFMAARREVGPGVRFHHPDLGDDAP
jgi:Asp-tRNA(Asn)/Glu-tRNA(Gln) amidotransferase C subunit